MIDYYRVLGIAAQASPEEVRRAYRRLAREHHPDVSPAPDATARMALVNRAYDVLSSPEKRAEYDGQRRPEPMIQTWMGGRIIVTYTVHSTEDWTTTGTDTW